jgi:hypothetical protein
MIIKAGDKVKFGDSIGEVLAIGLQKVKAKVFFRDTQSVNWLYICELTKVENQVNTEEPSQAPSPVEEATRKVAELEKQLEEARKAEQAAAVAAAIAEEKAALLARLDSDIELARATDALLQHFRNLVNGAEPTINNGTIYRRRHELAPLAESYSGQIVDLGTGSCSVVLSCPTM